MAFFPFVLFVLNLIPFFPIENFDKISGEVINLGNDEEISIKDSLQKIVELMGIEKDQLKTKGQGNIVGIDFNYAIESISDEKMVLLYTLTNDAGEKNGELNMNFKRVD